MSLPCPWLLPLPGRDGFTAPLAGKRGREEREGDGLPPVLFALAPSLAAGVVPAGLRPGKCCSRQRAGRERGSAGGQEGSTEWGSPEGRDRRGKRGGGVALDVRDCFDCTELSGSGDEVER